MTNSKYTHILAIVDRSGSMRGVARQMTEALNEYFEGQSKLDGKCLVDYVQFDNRYEKVYEDRDVSEAEAVIQARGSTALLDAIGRGATELGAKLRRKRESARPGTVLVVVVTDGYENSSTDWTADEVKDLIATQENTYNWEFVFLGANMDAVDVGTSFGFKAGSTLTYDTAYAGATAQSLGNYTTRTRSGVKDNAFNDSERLASVGG